MSNGFTLVGNNPWSWAAPADRYPSSMLDIANTAVARGNLYHAKKTGQSIPEGWALDEHGNMTTDPVAGIAGQVLPMAAHKGYAISMAMDVLSGILSAGQFGSSITGPYKKEGRSGAVGVLTTPRSCNLPLKKRGGVVLVVC